MKKILNGYSYYVKAGGMPHLLFLLISVLQVALNQKRP